MVHDTALSGLVIRILPPAERAVANGISTASASLSMLIGSSGALLLYARAGWAVTVLAVAAVFLLPLAVLSRLTVPLASARPTSEGRGAPWRELVSFFRMPHRAVWTLLVIPLFAVGEWLVSAPRSAMLLSARWSMDQIAVVQSLTIGVQVVAALGAGAVITRLGRSRTALLTGIVGVLGVAATFPLAVGDGSLVRTAAAMVGVTTIYTVKLTWIATVTMDLARPTSAATDYSVPMSIEGLFVTVVNSAGLGLAATAGYPWLVVAALAAGIAGTLVTPLWIRRNFAEH